MKSKHSKAFILVCGLTTASSSVMGHAFPVDPSKVPVSGVDRANWSSQYTLAYDSMDKSIVYYAPKTGRIATFNGMPLIGYTQLSDGRGILDAQFEFRVAESERDQMFNAIRAAGYSPVPMPFFKTKVIPVIPGISVATGKKECMTVEDRTTGERISECTNPLYDEVAFIANGPTLGENIAISAVLNPIGNAAMVHRLRSGNAIQVALEAQYYEAGDAFTATVEVNFEKLYESFSAAALAKGFLWKAEVQAFWDKQALCPGKDTSQCAVRVKYVDGRGRPIDNVSLDPDSPDTKLVLQAIDRLAQRLNEEMLTPIAAAFDGIARADARLGFSLSSKFQHRLQEKHATFEFKSPRGINSNSTTIVATAACIKIDNNGDLSKRFDDHCSNYWTGTQTLSALPWVHNLFLNQG